MDLTTAEKLKMIAIERGIDSTNLFGKIELLKEVLIHQTPKDANDFLIDTFMMIEDEIDFSFKELGLDEDVA
ncbi:hypothetical protein PF327_11235 [Sulfurovum sp. XTW-4]|uniref:Uncharacterized protein n=1 Tax=Sulfurovum xiamenensis TaxID=3019066 RepID=A0ABT7QUK9_9BACT|nr:hypothetical protein [Sulfurovum xiamenensis]MDM5264768.1 hypothetical protein [Sulfurovum xiamenensis]